jgi:ankyrin repeat protein
MLAAWVLPLIATRSIAEINLVQEPSVREIFTDQRLAQLAAAACEGDSAGIVAAIRAGAEVNGAGVEGMTPLIWAVACQSAAGVAALLETGADPDFVPEGGHFSPTCLAALKLNSDILEALLQHGGNPNCLRDNGDTAIVGALSLGVTADLWANYYLLLSHGADINYIDDMDWTIVDNAAALGRFDKVEELLGMNYRGDLTMLGGILQTRADWDSPAQAAARARVISYLLARGVNVGPRPS